MKSSLKDLVKKQSHRPWHDLPKKARRKRIKGNQQLYLWPWRKLLLCQVRILTPLTTKGYVSFFHHLVFNVVFVCKHQNTVDVMVSVLSSSAVGRGFKLKPWSSQTKDYKIGIFCFSTKHVALKRKSKDWLANQNNVSEWCDMSIRWWLFHWANSKNPTKRVGLVQRRSHHHFI